MSLPMFHPCNNPRGQAITDIIASVAREQDALAHILHAEGGKLEKVTGTQAVTSDQLLKTNRSVERMVNAIARLELVLQAKLDLFSDCLCECPGWFGAADETDEEDEEDNQDDQDNQDNQGEEAETEK